MYTYVVTHILHCHHHYRLQLVGWQMLLNFNTATDNNSCIILYRYSTVESLCVVDVKRQTSIADITRKCPD